MCELELEPCTVWSERERVARKEHRCTICRQPIRPGERYRSVFSVFEGQAQTEKACSVCQAMRAEFGEVHDIIPQPSDVETLLEECIISDDDEESERRWKPMLEAIRARRG